MLRNLLRERSQTRAAARLRLADLPAEPGFDRLIEQAADAFAAPIAALTIFQGDQLRVHAAKGLPLQCVPRADSFCNHVRDTPLEVCDALLDARFSHLPIVAEAPHVRYYAGVALMMTSSIDVGVLCVVDTRARPPASPDQHAYLAALARRAGHLLERNASIHQATIA